LTFTLDQAEEMLKLAKSRAHEAGIAVSISIVDARGDLIASVRMDGNRFHGPETSRGKAATSATFGQLSGALAERSNTPFYQHMVQVYPGRFNFGQGGAPIKIGGIIEGGIGVSGGSGQQDEDIALAAADSVA
jgi:uncharacterized protein GlcG (DUF336 family)